MTKTASAEEAYNLASALDANLCRGDSDGSTQVILHLIPREIQEGLSMNDQARVQISEGLVSLEFGKCALGLLPDLECSLLASKVDPALFSFRRFFCEMAR